MITKQGFGKTADGTEIDLYILKNKNGVEAAITNFGATVVSLKVPDRGGKFVDVLAGYDNVAGYEAGRAYFGGTVGRYANRIARGEFALDGVQYTLAKNNGPNTLHGGIKGFNKEIWKAEDISTAEEPRLKLHYRSIDGEEGFPGNLDVTVTYTLTDANELKIQFEATTDKATVVNLTNHCYFNLAGTGDVLPYQVTIFASHFIPTDHTQIPTGEIRSVQSTPFDFRQPTAIGARIDQQDEQLKIGMGYDHSFVIDRPRPNALQLAARALDPSSGRVLEVLTTEPGVHFYTGNHLEGNEHSKGKTYTFRTYFCLEVQHYADSPNHPNFPTTVLRPGETKRAQIIYKFSVQA